MSGLLPGERGVLTAIIVGVCFEVSELQDERGREAALALLGWRTDDFLRFLPSKLNEKNSLMEVIKSVLIPNSEADFQRKHLAVSLATPANNDAGVRPFWRRIPCLGAPTRHQVSAKDGILRA